MWIVMYCLTVLALSGLAFWMYRVAAENYRQRVIERYGEDEQPRSGFLRMSYTSDRTPKIQPEQARAERFEAGCADVLAQIERMEDEARRIQERRRVSNG